MKKRLFNNRGYTLFLTVLIIVLFGILSLSLITMVVSGAKKNVIREHVIQAGELAEKGMEHLTNQIQSELESGVGSSGLTLNEYETLLLNTLEKYKCTKEDGSLTALKKATGDYKVCVESYKNVVDEFGNENRLRKLVYIESTGIVDDKIQTHLYEVEIGTLDVPEALKYTLSTVMYENAEASDGNIYLHGGVEIYGDIKAAQHLFTMDHGVGLPLVKEGVEPVADWRKTTLPVMLPAHGKDQATIVLGGKLYQFAPKAYNLALNNKIIAKNNVTLRSSRAFYNNHLNWKNETLYEEKEVKELFANKSKLPIVEENDWIGISVQIEEEIKNANFEIIPTINEDRTLFDGFNSSNTVGFSGKENITFKNNNRFSSGKIDSANTTIFLSGYHQFDHLYISGNVIIGNESNSQNPINYDEIMIDGYSSDKGAILYVDGNVTIKGANLTSNLMIYTTGQLTVENSTIQGKKITHDRDGSLIAFTKGTIKIADVSLYQDDYSELKGFFYSEEDLVIFGIGSKIKIHGGIAAKRITLNAIRGNYEPGKSSWEYAINPTDLSSPSRLVVKYDTDLIENYLNFNTEPIIEHVDPPHLITREYRSH